MEDFRQGRYIAVISDVTATEIAPAPDFVKFLHHELLSLPIELIRVDDEAVSPVQSYIQRSVPGQRFINDRLHIALATIAEVDVLVSWNFKHRSP
ncbi:MAG: hypothetical protein ACRESZ_22120 [Methylococcales bacterium]